MDIRRARRLSGSDGCWMYGCCVLLLLCSNALGQELEEQELVELEPVEVLGRSTNLVGDVPSASAGLVGREQLERRPLLRPGELLETVPGLIATQHSGTGKANQYFLRGFNLDHGTDFRASLDGVPLNLRTHAHGQGYLDVNHLIPELVDLVVFRKGPYYADVGDFASAGSARFYYADVLPAGIAKLGIGEYDYRRALLADSPHLGAGNFLYALEAQTYDGPWVLEEDLEKYNSLFKYSQGTRLHGWSIGLSLYDAIWTSSDQIPRRAVESGRLPRFGTVDPTNGGETSRYTLYGNWRNEESESTTEANAYVAYYALNLFSNFTFFLDDPVNGDQIEQVGRRFYGGGNFEHAFGWGAWGERGELAFGADFRHDEIRDVALYETNNRDRLNTVRRDSVDETSLGLYLETRTRWTDKLRTVIGLRGDVYRFEVDALDPRNSGTVTDNIVNPKFSLVLGPWADTEYYLNLGGGFHSNDARGTTTTIDPVTGAPLNPVDPLVRSKGAEIGLRTAAIEGLRSTITLWYLELDSELVFVGDAGTNEPSRASERYGIEWTNYFTVNDWLTLTADLALTESQFTGADAGDEIPGALDRVVSLGAITDLPGGWFASLRARHFGPRPLTEDGRVESNATTLVNAQLGYAFGDDLRATLNLFNALDAEDDDITYFYISRLRGEPPAGIAAEHFHPVEPRQVRLMLTWYY